jgi:hypothetical protein
LSIGSDPYFIKSSTGSPDPRQRPFRPGQPPVSGQLSRPPAKELVYGPGFLPPFDVPAFACWVIVRPLRDWAFLTVGLPVLRTGPQRDCHVAHEQDTTGQDASFIPGTVVHTQPATTLRPAPAAFQRLAPTAPLALPIGGGHLHETSTEVHAIRPSPRRPHRRQGRGACSPPVFSSPVTPGWNGRPWASSPMLRTPRLPATHVEAETGHRALAWVLHLRHQSNLPRRLPLDLMHPHAARSPRWTPR